LRSSSRHPYCAVTFKIRELRRQSQAVGSDELQGNAGFKRCRTILESGKDSLPIPKTTHSSSSGLPFPLSTQKSGTTERSFRCGNKKYSSPLTAIINVRSVMKEVENDYTEPLPVASLQDTLTQSARRKVSFSTLLPS